MADMQGKRVLITGGARGIGLCTAEEFARAGSELILTDIDETALHYVGLVLYAHGAGQKVSASVSLRPQCQNLRRWFFDSPPQRCPEDEVAESYAAGPYFERGLMV